MRFESVGGFKRPKKIEMRKMKLSARFNYAKKIILAYLK